MKRNRRSILRVERDAPAIARRSLLDPLSDLMRPTLVRPSLISPVDWEAPLRTLEDRRTWHPGSVPTAWEPAKVIGGRPARLRASRRPSLLSPSPVVAFDVPERVAVCVRRKTRKEVIHAKGVAGGRVRRPSRSIYSSISCKG